MQGYESEQEDPHNLEEINVAGVLDLAVDVEHPVDADHAIGARGGSLVGVVDDSQVHAFEHLRVLHRVWEGFSGVRHLPPVHNGPRVRDHNTSWEWNILSL